MILHHFSPYLNDDEVTVDPDEAEPRRQKYSKAEFRESGVRRNFWYVDPKEKEGMIYGNHYTADVPEDKIYDLHKDDKGHTKSAEGKGVSWLLNKLHEEGYHGAKYNTGGRDIVTTWVPIKAKKMKPEQLARKEPESHTVQQAFHALENGHPLFAHADALEEEGHPLAPVFARLHNRELGKKFDGMWFDGKETVNYERTPLHGPTYMDLGYMHNAGGDLKRSVLVPALQIYMPKLKKEIGGQVHDIAQTFRVPLRKTEWAALHEHMTGRGEEYPWAANEEPDQLARIDWAKNGKSRFSDFTASNGKNYTVHAQESHSNPGHHSLTFAINDTPGNAFGVTGTGNAKEVFSKMIEHAHSLIHDHGAKSVMFAGDHREPSRIKFYDWLTKRANKIHPDFTGLKMEDNRDHIDESNYYLVHKDHLEELKKKLPKAEDIEVKQLGAYDEGRWYEDSPTLHEAYYTAANGVKYTIRANQRRPGVWGYNFTANGNTGITGTGHAKAVFDNVSELLKQHFKKNKPERILFSAAEPSRRKLYRTLLRRSVKGNPDYRAVENEDLGIYHAVHKDHVAKLMEQGGASLKQLAKEWEPPFEGSTNLRSSFETPGGKYVVDAKGTPSSRIGREPMRRLSFGMIDPEHGAQQFGLTGVGHSKAVFGHMIELVHDLLHKHQPPVVSFSSDNDEPTREKLYQKLVSKVGRIHPHYTGHMEHGDNHTQFYLVHRDHLPEFQQMFGTPREGVRQLAKGDNLHAIYPYGGWIHPEGHIIGNDAYMNHNEGDDLGLPDSPDGALNEAYRQGYVHVALYDNEVHASAPLRSLEKHRDTLKDIARGLDKDGSGKVIYHVKKGHGTPEQLSAVSDQTSQQGDERKKLLLRLLLEAKLKPIAAGNSYAVHPAGSDAGNYAEVLHNGEPNAVDYVGHYYGLLSGQSSYDLHAFHEGEGNHTLTVFDSPLQTDQLYEALGPAITSPMVRVLPKDGFNRVAVVNLSPDSGILKSANANNVQQFNGTFTTLRHRSSPGASASARETHRNAIRSYERQLDATQS